MGQEDILNFLSEHPDEWFTVEEIRFAVGVSTPPSRCLRAMRINGEVQSQQVRKNKFRYRNL